MKKTLGPDWSADDIAAGERFAEQWKTHAASAGGAEEAPIGAGQAKVAEVLARHEAALLAYPHVVAVADGICREGEAAGQPCIVVYVEKVLPPEELDEASRLPEELDGVRVEVVEAGEIGILPMK